MNYFLIKLKFDTAVHFGTSDSAQSLSASEDHICADTLFSALCHTALQTGGEERLNKLLDFVRAGQLLISDTMPWHDEDFYLPKPFVVSNAKKDLPAEKIKAIKKLNWIPVSSFQTFSESVKGGEVYEQSEVSFGFNTERTRAHISETDDTEPYSVGLYQFNPDCGLYFIAATENEEQEELLLKLVNSLGMSGIGGKISSGCGKFHVDDAILLNEFYDDQTQWLYNALQAETETGLLITSSLPKEEELETSMEGANYQLIRRSGFVGSEGYAENPMKKKTQYFIKAGSVFRNRFAGELYSVGAGGKHPVYRYSKPLFLGVDL